MPRQKSIKNYISNVRTVQNVSPLASKQCSPYNVPVTFENPLEFPPWFKSFSFCRVVNGFVNVFESLTFESGFQSGKKKIIIKNHRELSQMNMIGEIPQVYTGALSRCKSHGFDSYASGHLQRRVLFKSFLQNLFIENLIYCLVCKNKLRMD